MRLAFGTLTIIPVRPPRQVDRRTASAAMALAPVVGLVLGLPVAVLLSVLGDALPSLLGAALGIGALALITRGMHLDGLADTADGLGSGKAPEAALEIMRRSDVGPFGVATLTLTLLVQVAALQAVLTRSSGPAFLLVALVVSRAALPVLCSHGVPAARREGLGAGVAGSVSRAALALSLLAAALAVAGLLAVGGPDASEPATGLLVGLAPLAAAALLARRCVRRLGGVSGDVLGACVEVAFTVALVVLAIG